MISLGRNAEYIAVLEGNYRAVPIYIQLLATRVDA